MRASWLIALVRALPRLLKEVSPSAWPAPLTASLYPHAKELQELIEDGSLSVVLAADVLENVLARGGATMPRRMMEELGYTPVAKKTTEEARTAVVYVRITGTEREKLRAVATKEQRTLGEWARLILLAQIKKK